MARALIAGGGIAGLTAALSLARAGWDTTVFERSDVPGEIGAGIQISPNATKVLNWLGVLDDVRRDAFHPNAAVLRDGLDGEIVYQAPLNGAAQARWGAEYLHVHRADLHRSLIRAVERAGIKLNLGTAVDRVIAHPQTAALYLDDGRVFEGDLVVGADGIRSALRRAVAPDEAPRFSGQIAWRALVPADRLPAGAVAPDATVWAGAGQHLVTYFVRGGTLVNVVAVLERETWAEEGWSIPGDPAELRAAFSGWHPNVELVLGAVDECFLWGLFDRPEQVRWTRNKLVLIGDAAHPMLPFMAQGASQALEDCAALIRHLHPDNVPGSLSSWEDERWHRATRVQAAARANGKLFHRPPGIRRSLLRSVISTTSRYMPGLAASRLDWLYGFDAVAGPK